MGARGGTVRVAAAGVVWLSCVLPPMPQAVKSETTVIDEEHSELSRMQARVAAIQVGWNAAGWGRGKAKAPTAAVPMEPPPPRPNRPRAAQSAMAKHEEWMSQARKKLQQIDMQKEALLLRDALGKMKPVLVDAEQRAQDLRAQHEASHANFTTLVRTPLTSSSGGRARMAHPRPASPPVHRCSTGEQSQRAGGQANTHKEQHRQL